MCRTLPSNLALCVHPDFVYVKAKDPGTARVYVVAEALLHELPGAVPKESKKKDKSQPKKGGFEVSLHSFSWILYACVHPVFTVLGVTDDCETTLAVEW